MDYKPSFLSSRAVQSYNPQFLDTTPEMGATAPSSGSADLTNRLLQIMSGNLGGTLSSGEKLSALGALLKSVSRGSQTSPQQVMQSIQQQKMQEVQGALQIQELRKAAAEKAQYEKFRNDLIAQSTDPQEKAFLSIASPKALDQIAAQRFDKGKGDAYLDRLATYEKLKATDPARARVYWNMINRPQIIGSMETGLQRSYFPEPDLGAQTEGVDPELVAEAKKRGII